MLYVAVTRTIWPAACSWRPRGRACTSAGSDTIRIIVAGQVSREPHNALLHLFSASTETVGYGAGHYQQRSQDTSCWWDVCWGTIKGKE